VRELPNPHLRVSALSQHPSSLIRAKRSLPDILPGSKISPMTQRLRVLLVLASVTLVVSGSAVAAPKAAPPKVKREVVTIERTARHGLAALALIGKVKADRAPGFFAAVDRSQHGAELVSKADFSGTSGITRYGHGANESLCNAPVACDFNTSSNTFTFSITETDDADGPSSWSGVTRYLALEGTSIDLQVAAIGFTVKRHTRSTFARVSREAADADGINALGIGAEVFRAAQLRGGRRGSFALLQLPCDFQGAGAVTFTATGDQLPNLVHCDVQESVGPVTIYPVQVGPENQDYSGRGSFSRTANGATSWQVSGLATGVSSTVTRLFVLSY